MPVTVEWGNEEQTVSYFRFFGKWEWPEFHEAEAESRRLLSSVSHKVDLLLDFSESTPRLPLDVLSNFRKVAANAHPNRGIVVLVYRNTHLIRALSDVIRTFTPIAREVHIVEDLEASKLILEKYGTKI